MMVSNDRGNEQPEQQQQSAAVSSQQSAVCKQVALLAIALLAVVLRCVDRRDVLVRLLSVCRAVIRQGGGSNFLLAATKILA